MFPAPILPLQSNFYRNEDILELGTTTTTTTPGPVDIGDPETTSEEGEDEEALVGDVVCKVDEDCNTLNY